jgi:hypothetical protein
MKIETDQKSIPDARGQLFEGKTQIMREEPMKAARWKTLKSLLLFLESRTVMCRANVMMEGAVDEGQYLDLQLVGLFSDMGDTTSLSSGAGAGGVEDFLPAGSDVVQEVQLQYRSWERHSGK